MFSLPLGNVLSFSATAPDAVYYVRLRAMTRGRVRAADPTRCSSQLGQTAVPFPPLALLATVAGHGGARCSGPRTRCGPVVASYQLQAGTATGLVDIGVIPLPASARIAAR